MRRLETGALVALALGLSIAGHAVAGMYKWVDEQGAVHYSQTPPPDRTAQELAPPPPPPKPVEPEAGADATDTAPGESAPEGRPQEAENARKMRFQQNCTAARKNLQLYQTARRIMDGGQLVILTDEEKTKRIEKAKEQIERYCSD